ncbi:MAG: rRNA maturation RNase YbeY, partial [Clostridia bacterium]|nr:rRNA maturation RNase YbeY [Clostridia bacterium]
SFPMFEKEEIASLLLQNNNVIEDVLGDIVISIQQVENQAKEYGHSFNRELAYMIVHGFYHLMGYDHINDEDKRKMRPKEEKVLQELKLIRI